MGIVSLVTDLAGQIQVNPRRVKLVTTDNLATITAPGYLNSANLQGLQLQPTDFIDCVYSYTLTTNGYSGTKIVFQPVFANGVITLNKWYGLNAAFTQVFTIGFAQLAAGAKVNIVTASSPTATYFVQDVKVLQSAGLSGGNRLLTITDGTLVFNNAGITAAVLGTPVFTLWGGTGNPIPNGASDVSTAGANLYFVQSGGTTDYTGGSVQIAVTVAQITA